MALLTACASDPNRFNIVDVRQDGLRRTYTESFEEGYFRINDTGTIDVILRRMEPSAAPDDQVTQLVHLHGVWRSIPGRTVAESTQVNGTVVYAVEIGRSGSTYEGGGSIFFTMHDDGEEVRGSLDRALLRPTRRLAASADVFEYVELRGAFRARRDDRQTVRMLNEIDRRFRTTPPRPAP